MTNRHLLGLALIPLVPLDLIRIDRQLLYLGPIIGGTLTAMPNVSFADREKQ
jgi:hypothetical protein